MRSSISASDGRGPGAAGSTPAIVAFLALCVLFVMATELWARYALASIDRGMKREMLEYQAAVDMRTGNSGKMLLVMGNSLLGEGVEFDVLRNALAPEWDARRLYVDDTNYFDLYYALRRLHAEGARFNVVALVLIPRQLISHRVRGDYFAYRLMSPSDIIGVARDADLHRTVAASMLFARFSAFYGLRSEIRNDILGRLMPDLTPLMRMITRNKGEPLADEAVYDVALQHLEAYRQLTDAYDAKLILILPPQIKPEGVEAAKRAGAAAHVAVVTVPGDLTGHADYSDGFHLNSAGAKKYTAALIPAMKEVIESSGLSGSNQLSLAGMGGHASLSK